MTDVLSWNNLQARVPTDPAYVYRAAGKRLGWQTEAFCWRTEYGTYNTINTYPPEGARTLAPQDSRNMRVASLLSQNHH